jgi:hypothetical protein
MCGNRRLRVALLVLGLWGRGSAAPAQQRPEVRYRLTAIVDDTAGVVRGSGSIQYRYLGADTLRSLPLSLGYNAYRPGATGWPAKPLTPPEAGASGFLRIAELWVNGEPARLDFPAAPDSSAARLELARGLGRGDSVTIAFRWEARPPALPWRMSRDGRRLDLVGWYPRLIDETAGTTLPFPAFAAFLLNLDVAADQVIGGTGVALCGDPGWAGAATSPRMPVTLQRDWYRTPRDPEAAAARCDPPAPGRKRVVWYAEDAMEVSYALSPDFRYEEGDFRERPVHALYRRGQERTWGAGLAARRTETAMAWTLELGDRYPWPQLTIVEGLGGNGEALPMMLLVDGAPSQSAVLSSMGLMITEQMLAGGARVFTLGTAAYQTAWFFEVLGRQRDYLTIEREILDWDLDRLGIRDEPLGPVTSVSACVTVFCRRTEFMSYQLRRWAGSDEAMRNLYRALYTRYLLRATVPGAFQRTAQEMITPRPDTLYVQLMRGDLYDDAVSARREPVGDGSWRTQVVVERRAAGVFPQTVEVVAESDTAVVRAVAMVPRETLTVVTRSRPRRVVVDPNAESHDWNMLNNQHAFGFQSGWLLLAPQRPSQDYLDTYFTRHMNRAQLTRGWAPTVWYNDAGGWTFGMRLRENYLDRFELNELWGSVSTAAGVTNGRIDLNGLFRVRNPVWLRAPGWSQSFGAAWVEGRAQAGVELTRRFRTRLADSTLRTLSAGVNWLSVTDREYLDRRYYDDAGTVEAGLTGRLSRPGRWPLTLEAAVTGGYAYANRGSAIGGGGYGRVTMAASLRTPLDRPLRLGARLYAGTILTADSVPRQRRLFLAGADPYQRFDSPFLRSHGSLLARPGLYYHAPGGGGVRGLDPRVSAPNLLAASLEAEYAVLRRVPGSFLSRVALAAFGDGALADGDLRPGGAGLRSVADAGVGLRLDLRIGQTAFQPRLDLPLWVSRPALAQHDGGKAPVAFRWSFSFLPAF